MPLEFMVPSLRIAVDHNLDYNAVLRARLEKLMTLDEQQQMSYLVSADSAKPVGKHGMTRISSQGNTRRVTWCYSISHEWDQRSLI